MRIALIGPFDPKIDEGMRRLSVDLRGVLCQSDDVLAMSPQEFRSLRGIGMLRAFRPDCLHYISGPTLFSLLALRFHQVFSLGAVPTFATGLRPWLGPLSRRLLRLYAPTVFLSQSKIWHDLFETSGSKVIEFANWIDCKRFRVASDSERRRLRTQFSLPDDKPIVLHVGHLTKHRNLGCLLSIQRSGRFQVLVVASESLSDDDDCKAQLESEGCLVRRTYFPNIEDVYAACDYYVFSARPLPAGRFPRFRGEIGVIDFPLSILEAMACGLPVVTTPHQTVKHFIGDVSGLAYFDGSADDCLLKLDAVSQQAHNVRAIAERFDLKKCVERLKQLYAEHAMS